MKTKLIVAALLGGVVLIGPVSRAEDAPTSKPATSAPAGGGKTFEATDIEGLKAMDGKEATVHGKVADVFKSNRSGIMLVNFEGAKRDFVGLIEKDNVEALNAGFSGDVKAALVGKTVTIIGPIKIYKDKPEVVISKPEQINVESGGDEAKPDVKKPEEKKD
jgi:hypothetical protein